MHHAAGAVHSLLGLGANPHILAGAVRAVIGQLLARRNCEACAKPLDPPATGISFDDIQDRLPAGFTPCIKRGPGCDACGATGFQGLFGMFEVIRSTPQIDALIERQEMPDIIETQSVREGMTPLRVAAKVALAKGFTTPEEVMHVIQP